MCVIRVQVALDGSSISSPSWVESSITRPKSHVVAEPGVMKIALPKD